MVFLRGSNRQLARCEKPDVSVHPSLLSQAWMKTCLKRECKPGADVPDQEMQRRIEGLQEENSGSERNLKTRFLDSQ
ncbi:hypothetical protein G5714_001451 [Onychostoma macrolepis]|uniref:Uncharacterized protein n=1 Tax=Onychostoma macrolepis TaxID=369639 RepID=A0A7J6DC49_9TELE|nr:hypothetical protein G5714_001451 [Onychostoma macrolepis]